MDKIPVVCLHKRSKGKGKRDFGYAEGRLSDNRPYRLECWQEMDTRVLMTVYVSVLGIEHLSSEEVIGLLEENGIFRRDARYPGGVVMVYSDLRGNQFFAVTAILTEYDMVRTEILVALTPQ